MKYIHFKKAFQLEVILSAFVVIFIISFSIGFSCRAESYKFPAKQQALSLADIFNQHILRPS